jgi:hypothetical protein
MLWLPPEEFLPKGPPCVLDVALSLAPAGLYWTLGLARALPVWLPQFHWAIVDDHTFACDRQLVSSLVGGADYEEASGAFARIRDEWRQARDEFGLESFPGLFWPGDGRAESVVPKDNDRSVIDRFHVLAAGLDARRNGLRNSPDVVNAADGARDVLALAVAVGDRRTIILTPVAAGRATPALVEHLGSIGIACRELTDPVLVQSLRAAVVPALLASGLAIALACDQVRLAALSVVAPRSLTAAELAANLALSDDSFALDAGVDQGESALWDGAAAIWWELP